MKVRVDPYSIKALRLFDWVKASELGDYSFAALSNIPLPKIIIDARAIEGADYKIIHGEEIVSQIKYASNFYDRGDTVWKSRRLDQTKLDILYIYRPTTDRWLQFILKMYNGGQS